MSSICETCGALQPETATREMAFTPPELASLLASNDPPLDSAIPRILETISVGQDRIDALDPQIRALDLQIPVLQAHLASLVRERDEAVKSVRDHRIVLSPLRRVPPEVLCEIFCLSIDGSGEEEKEEGVISLPKPPSPWYLGHICRFWRHTALSYPPLWTHLDIREDLPRIEAQLLRAGNAMLDVYWSGRQYEGNTDGLSDLMCPHYARWRTLHIDSYEFAGADAPEWLRLANGHLAQLTTLEIINTRRVEIPDFLSATPNLRHVLLNGVNFEDYSPSTPIPWAQITHYRGTFHPQRQVKILKDAQNLLVCSVGFTLRVLDPLSVPLVTLPRLRRLNTERGEFLTYLTAPALQELTSLHTQLDAMPLLLSFISTSSCTLTTLALFDCAVSMELVPVLQSVPSLAHLFIESGGDPDYSSWVTYNAVFSAMTLPTAPLLCPNLDSLVYGYLGDYMTPEETFFDMARSRFSDRLHTLKRLRIFAVHKNPERTPAGAIALLRADGFDAEFLDAREARKLRRVHQF
ncbi:hypothetical protein C8R46DRAFT_1294093 [Mycena filopes]|nr:hypothetical protein C8R46DRAFT_1294093 [Mycena filopes]